MIMNRIEGRATVCCGLLGLSHWMISFSIWIKAGIRFNTVLAPLQRTDIVLGSNRCIKMKIADAIFIKNQVIAIKFNALLVMATDFAGSFSIPVIARMQSIFSTTTSASW